jgi:hypothetical protein
MDIVFFITVGIVGVISAAISFVPSEKMGRGMKTILFFFIALCLLFQGWYGWQEKKSSDLKAFKDALYQDESLRGQVSISQDIKELKEKEKKGLLSESDYSLYIARYLESIDQTLKFRDGKNTREWVTTYYDEVSKIPSYFSIADWKEAEKLIYDSMVNEINGHFAARGTFDSGMRPKALETFKTERERVIKAKELGK